MRSYTSTQATSGDRAIAGFLAAFSMFVVGYTATRVYLAQPAESGAIESVTPHQATLWDGLGR
ncbi:MAG: hypothetical protein F6K04_23925 [Leptolyngbya sp. SIO4C5]|nr:hypothetical protein [Leptolyngbya sp. SIO4C5]